GYATILLETQPAEALRYYELSDGISSRLESEDPARTTYRINSAIASLGAGKSLHRLGRNREALDRFEKVRTALQSLAATYPDPLYLLVQDVRLHGAEGDAWMASGDPAAAEEHYRQALSGSEELVRRAPSSLYYQRRQADSYESLGQYFAT